MECCWKLNDRYVAGNLSENGEVTTLIQSIAEDRSMGFAEEAYQRQRGWCSVLTWSLKEVKIKERLPFLVCKWRNSELGKNVC